MAKVSVVIPTYNYGRFIAEAIGSVLEQTQPADEIIVVDDGSADDTAEIVAAFGESLRYIRQENAGVCAARNRGVAESAAEFIAFMDADDIWHPTKLEKQLKKFAEDPDVGLVHCGMREFDNETGETIGLYLQGGEGSVWKGLLLWEAGSEIVGPGGTILTKRSAFEAAGGFDPRQKVGEDWDLCYRITRHFKVAFVPEALVDYRSHAASAHHNVAEMDKGMTLFLEKAFAEDDAEVQQLRRRAYGNLHRVLAGSYLHAGNYGQFVRHSIRSLMYRPAGIAYFAAFPFRRLTARKS